MGLILIALGAFRYDDVAGWGFVAVGVGFFAKCLGFQRTQRQGVIYKTILTKQ